MYAEKNEISYAINISCIIESDRKTIKRLKFIFGIIGIASTAVSYALGTNFLVINCVLFVLPLLAPIAESARRSAMDHIMEIAVILYRWRADSQDSCDDFINNASSLLPLYNTIKQVS